MLGLATGPVCMASCGPVVVPWLLAQPSGVRAGARQLAAFLGARLVGYLLFACVVWLAGAVLSRLGSGRLWFYGLIQLLLAAALGAYAAGWPRCSGHAPAATPLVQIDEGPKPLPIGAVILGFLTGLSLCPPFLVAGVRAAQLSSLPTALVFFAIFFAGTAVWFLPLVTLGFIRRAPQVALVARMTALLVAVYYGWLGMHALLTRISHG